MRDDRRIIVVEDDPKANEGLAMRTLAKAVAAALG